MSRNRRNARSLQRTRRNDGPEELSQAADHKLKNSAHVVVDALWDATVNNHDASAANVLVELAEAAEYAEREALIKRMNSLASRWSEEPEVAVTDTARQLGAPVSTRLLTSGQPHPFPEEGGEILDAEFE